MSRSSTPPFTTRPFFFFNDTPTTETSTLSLHDALPIWPRRRPGSRAGNRGGCCLLRAWRSSRGRVRGANNSRRDRKSTRLNSSHSSISYAVFCLKKKNQKNFRQVKDQFLYTQSEVIKRC